LSIKLLKQSSLYSVGKLFAFAAGLISYPILTKTLSVEEYGTVALLTVTIGLMSSFVKFGVQQSIIRFKHDFDKPIFSSNILALSLSLTILTVCFLFLIGAVARQYSAMSLFQNPVYIIILFSAAFQALQSFCINLLISSEKSVAVTTLGIIYKLLSLSTMLIAILLISASSFSFIIALLIADAIYLTVLIFWIFKNKHLSGFSYALVDKTIIRNFLLFGIPMFGYEMSNMFHAFSDRFLIEMYLGREKLGLYSASYNMAKMMSDLILGGLVIAILPQYLAIWKKQGKSATELFLSNVNNIILLFLPIVIAGIYAISDDLLAILTTKQYQAHSYLLPIILVGTLLFNLGMIYSAGLQIQKKSKTMLRVVIESAILNLLLNIFLIPKYGLISAAINTVVSYLWASFRFYFLTRQHLKISFDLLLFSRAIAYAVIMYLAIIQIEFSSEIMSLLIKIFLGGVITVFLIYTFEAKIRDEIIALIKKRFN